MYVDAHTPIRATKSFHFFPFNSSGKGLRMFLCVTPFIFVRWAVEHDGIRVSSQPCLRKIVLLDIYKLECKKSNR